MYRFGISYYIMSAANRIPLSGLHVKLVKPGETFELGIRLEEKPVDSGYYETDKLYEPDWGFYEIWDDRLEPRGSFSGKTCTVGKLDSKGIKDKAILNNHVDNEAITSDKISDNAVQPNHFSDSSIVLSKIAHEIQTENQGVGEPSQQTPPRIDDNMVIHTLLKEYRTMPHVILTPHCDTNMYIKDIKLESGIVTITIAMGQRFDAEEWRYTILVIATESY
jgi:hypothetical protein